MLLAAVALALSPAITTAPSVPGAADAPLAELVAEALARNPDILAAEAAVGATRQRAAQASALPDPMLLVGYTNDGWSPSLGSQEMTTLGIMASQDLPFPGKRRLRGEVAELDSRRSEQQLARARLWLAAEVKRAYSGLLLARELLVIAGEQKEVWRQIESSVRTRYAVGQGAQQDVLRVQVELTRIEEAETNQRAEGEIRLAELNRLIARPTGSPLETPSSLAVQVTDLSARDALDQARNVSPELASARLAVERDQVSVALAHKEYRPDFSVQAGYMNRGGLDPMWQAGVGVTLPFRRARRSAAVAEATALSQASSRLVESLELQVRYRTEERLTRLRSTERIIDIYRRGIVPQDRMSMEAAIASYQSGKVPFVAVLEALQTLYGDRTSLARLGADHARLLASLEEVSLESSSEMLAGSEASRGTSVTGAMGGGMGGR
jgi:outer membrane protein, heavy metal efflux system